MTRPLVVLAIVHGDRHYSLPRREERTDRATGFLGFMSGQIMIECLLLLLSFLSLLDIFYISRIDI